jgi:ketosteroid isomerase-like protein
VEVLAEGKLALSRGPYLVTSRDEQGQLRETWGTFNSVWRRHQDGKWRVVFDAGSPAAGELPRNARELLSQRPDCQHEF